MARVRKDNLNTSSAQRIIACALCVALGTIGIVPIAAYADPETSTQIVEEAPALSEAAALEGASQQAEQAEKKASEAKKAAAAKRKAEKKAAKEKKAAAKAAAEKKAKVATAKQAIAEMNALSTQMETAYEDLNQQQEQLDKLKKEIKKLKKDIKEADENLAAAKDSVEAWAKNTYINGSVRYMSVLLGATTFGDFVSRLAFMSTITEEEQHEVVRIQILQKDLDKNNEELKEKYTEQKALTAEVTAKATAIQEALVDQANYFAALPSDIRNQVLSYDGEKNSLPSTAGLTGSTSTKGSHPEVATMALKYLGVPYVWGGETPSGFDCSGLTMYCYKKAANISLTHFARTQYSEGLHISKVALMPGDLVFFGSDVASIHHVGIYLGNDKFIHAPHTGDVVKISTLSSRSDFIGACRP